MGHLALNFTESIAIFYCYTGISPIKLLEVSCKYISDVNKYITHTLKHSRIQNCALTQDVGAVVTASQMPITRTVPRLSTGAGETEGCKRKFRIVSNQKSNRILQVRIFYRQASEKTKRFVHSILNSLMATLLLRSCKCDNS